jgi:hypothetical protein
MKNQFLVPGTITFAAASGQELSDDIFHDTENHMIEADSAARDIVHVTDLFTTIACLPGWSK